MLSSKTRKILLKTTKRFTSLLLKPMTLMRKYSRMSIESKKRTNALKQL